MIAPVFRFAPSPNGELHLGHAFSALLNERMAREREGRFLVRIEDIDTVRCTADFAEKALNDLSWLGLNWELPVRYQSQHLADYARHQDQLQSEGLLYPCFCTRKTVAERSAGLARDPEGQPVYDGTCRRLTPLRVAERIAASEPHSLRLDMAAATRRLNRRLPLDPLPWGDVIIVRKDIGTSYHVAVVTDDALQGITHVVRGRDLEASTSIHVLLQTLLGFPVPEYVHHRLITDKTGHKLSKSLGSKSLRALRAEGVTPAAIRQALGFS